LTAPVVTTTALATTHSVSYSVRADGVAVISLASPFEQDNRLDRQVVAELLGVLGRLETDSSCLGAVLISARKDFMLGTQLASLKTIKFASEAELFSRDITSAFRRLGTLSKPVVAAVHGAALGSGFELALACRAIVAVNNDATTFGFPEVCVGLLPGAHGLLRVAERAGLGAALDLGLSGKPVSSARAMVLGLVDEICPLSVLLDVASRWARQFAFGIAPDPVRRLPSWEDAQSFLFESNPIGRRLLLARARGESHLKTHGHYPAPERIVDVLERYMKRGIDAAGELEAKFFGELVVSETAHHLIALFYAAEAQHADSGVDVADGTVEAHPVEHVAVLGGGVMGSGIAYVTTASGIPVRLKERDDAGVGRALSYVKRLFDERVACHELTWMQRDRAFSLLSATSGLTGLGGADVVIEAVFEDLSLKQALLREFESLTKPTAIFASNTSSIPIGRIAEAARRPEQVVGMHYFSPVQRTELLEVVRAEKTAPHVVATVVALGKRQGKTVIVVKDSVGFYTSRILAPYLNEAVQLLSEGITVEAIDKALVDWGWAVGPFQLVDELGLDLVAHVAEMVHGAFGERLIPPDAMVRLIGDDRKGRKNSRGFYSYGYPSTPERRVDTTVYRSLEVEPHGRLPQEEIQMRCGLQLVNEALHAFGDGILRSAREGDLGAVLGLGFPRFRGGPFRYVDTLGAEEVLRRVQGYCDRLGRRWSPAPVLVDMAKKGRRFHV
jgi:3-hydroxyacyl-CoA dehydrogenase/enoyl-CoA hydratase/3-hydroxybutyryl-CoA epimerase